MTRRLLLILLVVAMLNVVGCGRSTPIAVDKFGSSGNTDKYVIYRGKVRAQFIQLAHLQGFIYRDRLIDKRAASLIDRLATVKPNATTDQLRHAAGEPSRKIDLGWIYEWKGEMTSFWVLIMIRENRVVDMYKGHNEELLQKTISSHRAYRGTGQN